MYLNTPNQSIKIYFALKSADYFTTNIIHQVKGPQKFFIYGHRYSQILNKPQKLFSEIR